MSEQIIKASELSTGASLTSQCVQPVASDDMLNAGVAVKQNLIHFLQVSK